MSTVTNVLSKFKLSCTASYNYYEYIPDYFVDKRLTIKSTNLYISKEICGTSCKIFIYVCTYVAINGNFSFFVNLALKPKNPVLPLSKPQESIQSVLSNCQCNSRGKSKGSITLTLYLHLIDQMGELLQSYDHEIMMEQCRSLMGSDHTDIKLFTSDQLKAFSQYNSAILLRMLCLFTWSNCSILRALVNYCDEAVKLLDNFESNLDCLQLIASYPIPHFSPDMIPNETSTYTILAVRYDKELYQCTLQYVYDVRSVMIEKCDITQHCLQLLAVRSDPTILYWTIPKCVVDLINTNVPLHSEHLYSRGILEVAVYPDLRLTTGDAICYGSLAFKCENQSFSEKVYLHIVQLTLY